MAPNEGVSMIGKTLSHYRILEKLGGGGMGVVYELRHATLDRCPFLIYGQLMPSVVSGKEAG